MKRIAALLLIAILCARIGWGIYQVALPAPPPLSKYVPAGSMLYLEANDFSSLLSNWNASPEKKQWITSTSYEVFSRSRLFLRLKGAGDQFATAAGLPPDMNFLSQIAGDDSALALYDIGKLQFLYITHLSSARSLQTDLWRMRAKFEPRTAGNLTFYIQRDPESQREVAFAISGDYLLLATREDLIAGALQLMSGAQQQTIESEQWWLQATTASERAGDLRMVLNMTKVVPDGYFRTYWVQQNITDLSQYSAAVSDLFLSDKVYREERALIRKSEPDSVPSPEVLTATADLVRLVPEDAGTYQALANPSPHFCFELLSAKLLAPHLGPAATVVMAPQVQLTSGEAGSGADLETRIDQAPAERSVQEEKSMLEVLLNKTPIRAALQVQSTERDKAGVFVRIRSAIVLVSTANWNETEVQSAVASLVRPSLTASELGVGWQDRSLYREMDGLWPLLMVVRGNYLLISDDSAMTGEMLAKFDRKSDQQPAEFFGGFNHARERENFARFSNVVDRPSAFANSEQDTGRVPQFFSGTVASLSSSWSSIVTENIVIRRDKEKLRQTVTYTWDR
jgi:hypothetical protein